MKQNHFWLHFARPGPYWVSISMLLYLVACFMPAIRVSPGDSSAPGWICLVLGAQVTYQGLMEGWNYVIPSPVISVWWLGNLLYFLAILCHWRQLYRTALILGGLAVLPAIHFEFAARDELLSGSVVWVISLQVFAMNAIWRVWIDHRNRDGAALNVD